MASDAAPRVMPAPPPAPFHPFRILPGRLFILSGVSLVLVWLLGQVTTVPPLVEAFRKVASLALRVSVVWLAVVVLVRFRRQFLWRVRRKLILSYIFLGLVPVALVIVFASVAAVIVHGSAASYLFNDGLQDIQEPPRKRFTVAGVVAGGGSRRRGHEPARHGRRLETRCGTAGRRAGVGARQGVGQAAGDGIG
jgi:hypothetical protein